jgi:hypothetical protein
MRSTRLVIFGALALGSAVPFAWACGDSSFQPSSSDASIAEATTSDSTIETSVADAATFCNTQKNAILCVDFDESDLRSGFELGSVTTFFPALQSSGGGIVGAAEAGLSPPTALEVALPVDAGPETDAAVETAGAAGALSAVPGATHFRLEADLRFNHIGDLSNGNISFGGLDLGGEVAHVVYVLAVRGGHIYVDAFSPPLFYANLDLGSLPAEGPTWNHLVIDITSGTGGQISGSIDGRATVSAASLANHDEVTPTLSIGLSTMGGTGLLDMSFDNVLLFADTPDGGPSTQVDSGAVSADGGADSG